VQEQRKAGLEERRVLQQLLGEQEREVQLARQQLRFVEREKELVGGGVRGKGSS